VAEWQEELMDWHVRHERFSRRAPLEAGSGRGGRTLDELEGEEGVDLSLSASTTISGGEEEAGQGGSSGLDEEDGEEEEGAQQDPMREALLKESAGGRLETGMAPGQRRGKAGHSARRSARRGVGAGLDEEDYVQSGEEGEGRSEEGRPSGLIPPWVQGWHGRARREMGRGQAERDKVEAQEEGQARIRRPKARRERSKGLRLLREKTFRMITGNPAGAIAFVSFRSLAVASVAGQCVTYRHPLKMMTKPAPAPADIIWTNAYMPMRLLPIKTVLGVGSSVVVTLFFSVIVGIIASLTNVQTLHDHVPFMRNFLEKSKLAQELLPYLPAFLLVMVDCTIPPILSLLARVVFREVRTVSEAHVTVFRRLYLFLMYNNFLILFLSSSLNTYYAIVEDPHLTLVELGIFLPNISSFYIAYIMIKVLCSHPMELSRMSSFFVAGIRWFFTDDLTEAQKAARILGCNALERPGGFYYGYVRSMPLSCPARRRGLSPVWLATGSRMAWKRDLPCHAL